MMMNKKLLHSLAAGLIIFLIICSCTSPRKPLAQAGQGPGAAARQESWDRAFSAGTGWTGGDVAASFIIPGHRALWVFGDTFVGRVEEGRRVKTTLVNNSIAVHDYDPAHPGQPPAPGRVKFIWGDPGKDGKPQAWVRPAHQEEADNTEKTWYWPTGGGITISGSESGAGLALFLIQIAKTRAADSIWAFQVIAGAIAMVDRVERPAESWRPRVIELPHSLDRRKTEAQENMIDWGVAVLERNAARQARKYIFIYGVESRSPADKDLLLARAPRDGLEDFSGWEFYRGGQWSSRVAEASPIISQIATELSVDRMTDRAGKTFYLMVHSEPLLGGRIFLRTADEPEGPWSEPVPIYQVPEVQQSQTRFTYAAKGHAGLSQRGTLLVSFIVSSHDFRELVSDASLYRPQFLTVPVDDKEIKYFGREKR